MHPNSSVIEENRRITKIQPFITKYKWKGINFPSEKRRLEKCQKNIVKIALNVVLKIAPNVLYAKKIYILLMFQNITQIVKNNFFF